ncbi:MAG: hypothetical protein AAGE59_23750, partial [Cyanobacteria bacterium P01_F01_bin.86]
LIIANWGRVKAMFSAVKAALAGLIAGIISGAARTVSAVVQMGAQILAAISRLAAQAFNAGRQIVQRIAQGILSGIGAVVNAAKSVASAVMSVLPNSPVPTGPLTALNNPSRGPGGKIVDMLAAGITSRAGQIGSALGQAVSPGASPTSLFPSQSAAGSNGPITINAPLNLTANGGDPESIKAALQEHRDEIFRMIDQYSQQRVRLNYG